MIEMPSIAVDWQSVVTLAIVLAALAGLARRCWALVAAKSPSGCGSSCSGCSANVSQASSLVQLDLKPSPHRPK
jgi:hypothetical protein